MGCTKHVTNFTVVILIEMLIMCYSTLCWVTFLSYYDILISHHKRSQFDQN